MKYLLLLLTCTLSLPAATIQLEVPSSVTDAQMNYLINSGQAAIEEAGHTLSIKKQEIVRLPLESYELEAGTRKIRVRAADSRGALYAILDLAEQLGAGNQPDSLRTGLIHPKIRFRAIQFMLPWGGDFPESGVAQHRETCRNLDFWAAFLDMMVENRFNSLTLWTRQPTCLLSPPSGESGVGDAEISQWKSLWQAVFVMAVERGIETYLVSSGESVQAGTIEALLQAYPGLTGLGIRSTAEGDGPVVESVLEGIRAGGRPAKLLYCMPQNSSGEPANDPSLEAMRQADLVERVYVQFDYNGPNGHASPKLLTEEAGAADIDDSFKKIWRVGNTGFHRLRWGQPAFVRAFIRNNDPASLNGVVIGSDQFIPAADTLSLDGAFKDWTWQFQKQWLFYAIWGRLLYDPSTPDLVFESMFTDRYPGSDGSKLLRAWTLASSFSVELAAFHRSDDHAVLYAEAFSRLQRNSSYLDWIDINQFITHPVLDSGSINIREFARGSASSWKTKSTPFNLVKRLQDAYRELEKLLEELKEGISTDEPLAAELADLEAWYYFGWYFAEKLKAGVAMDTGRSNSSKIHLIKARVGLNRAVDLWDGYVKAATRFNREADTLPYGQSVSLAALIPKVRKDVVLSQEYYPNGISWSEASFKGLPHARHEAALVEHKGRLYLLGGRRVQPVDELILSTDEWKALAAPPLELHHFQAVVYGDQIWVIGAMTGKYPDETPVPHAYIFDPKANAWSVGPEIPEDRRRGSAGVVLLDGQIYMIGGIRKGHRGGYVSWVDRLDPETGKWDVLPDAPHARDHFQAVAIDGKIYAAGGRRTSADTGEVFSLTVPAVDAFDVGSGTWSTVSNLPTPRAGTSSVAVKGYLVVAGGESDAREQAFDTVEAFNPNTHEWVDWPSLKTGRHGTGMVLLGDRLYTASGCGRRGGNPELVSVEILTVGD